jgi:hypothetical protein
MKIESLKHSKFVMNKKEMGSCVGGDVTHQETGAGERIGARWEPVLKHSSDCIKTTTDTAGKVTETTTVYHKDSEDAVVKNPCDEKYFEEKNVSAGFSISNLSGVVSGFSISSSTIFSI